MEISLASQPNLREVFYCQIMIFWQFITSDNWTFYFIKKRGQDPPDPPLDPPRAM